MLFFPKSIHCKTPPRFSAISLSHHLLFKSLLFKSLIVTILEVYKFYALINKNKEKTLQCRYNVIASKLQCDRFKLPKYVLLTFSGKMNSLVKSLLASHFTLLTSFLTLSEKTNGFQTNAGHDNTEHASTTSIACITLSVYQKK